MYQFLLVYIQLQLALLQNTFQLVESHLCCGGQWTVPQLSIMIIYNSTWSILIQQIRILSVDNLTQKTQKKDPFTSLHKIKASLPHWAEFEILRNGALGQIVYCTQESCVWNMKRQHFVETSRSKFYVQRDILIMTEPFKIKFQDIEVINI